jgi:hypothetical protein
MSSSGSTRAIMAALVANAGIAVANTCYTPRSDDPGQDAENMMDTHIRIAYQSELVELAVFADTKVDLSKHPKAVRR